MLLLLLVGTAAAEQREEMQYLLVKEAKDLNRAWESDKRGRGKEKREGVD